MMTSKTGSKEIVRAPRTVKQEALIQGLIFSPADRPLSRNELHQRLYAALRSWLTAVCSWKPRDPSGRFRYLIFSFEPRRGVNVFVQFWSEPLEPVCWQVSSGHTDPPTRRWLGDERAERIRVFGFEIGGDAENFEQFVAVNSARGVARSARVVVDILYSAFDYRGQQPLKVEVGAGTHVPTQKVYDSFTPTEVMEAMTEQAHSLVSREDDETAAMLRIRRRGIYTAVEFSDLCEGTRSFRTMELTCELEPRSEDVVRLTAATRSLVPPGGTAVVRLGDTLRFSGGVTMDWLRQRIAEWVRMTAAYRRQQRPRRAPATAVPGRTSQVH